MMPECRKVPLSCTLALALLGILQECHPPVLSAGLLGTIAMPVKKEVHHQQLTLAFIESSTANQIMYKSKTAFLLEQFYICP
jgi:hypothetical protein